MTIRFGNVSLSAIRLFEVVVKEATSSALAKTLVGRKTTKIQAQSSRTLVGNTLKQFTSTMDYPFNIES
jgi:hypothetical protein